MKKTPFPADPNDYPPGWDRARVEAVVRHYDEQTDEERAAAIESGEEVGSWIRVPRDLISEVRALIQAHQQKAS